jgi:hypothetical protein
MGDTRRNLQAHPKILKNSSKHQIYQSEQKLLKKIVGTLNEPIRAKIFRKKHYV